MAENVIQSPLEIKGLSKYLSFAFHRSVERALWTFCELGVADLMIHHQRPVTALQISQSNGNNWNAEFLYRLLRVIADAGIVTAVETNDDNRNKINRPEETIGFQLTEDGLLLTNDHFSKARDMIRIELNPNVERSYAYLPSVIKDGYKNGNSFEQAFGCSIFDYMQKDENREYTNLFNNSMLTYSVHLIESMVSVVDFGRFNKLLDIAGGLGTLLSSVLEKNPYLHGILFDLDHVIASAKSLSPNEFERRKIEASRYEFIAGDMFNSETIPEADAYTLKFIIHDWNDEKAIEILRAIRAANKMSTKKMISIFLVEAVILSNGKDSCEAHAMDLEMLSSLSAKERTLAEYIYLLEKSGYEFKQIYKTKGAMSIIEATTII